MKRAIAAVAATVLVACSQPPPAQPGPDLAVPAGKMLLGTFSGEIDPEAGTLTMRVDRSAGTARKALTEITGVVLSNPPPTRGTDCPGASESLSAEVTIAAAPFDETTLYTDVYAEITAMTPATGVTGCNSVTPPVGSGLTNDLGLWYYPSLGNSNGVTTTWRFHWASGTSSTFSGKVWGTSNTVAAIKSAFVSSTLYDGNLGGLTGADEKCQARADVGIAAGKLPAGSTYKAFLSTGSPAVNAADRIPDAAYIRTDGQVIAFSKNGLLSATLNARLERTETGSAPPGYYPWTGSNAAGNIGAYHCLSWTSNVFSDDGIVGWVLGDNGLFGSWLYSESFLCSAVLSLYCFQQ